jgi:hypothetical protein
MGDRLRSRQAFLDFIREDRDDLMGNGDLLVAPARTHSVSIARGRWMHRAGLIGLPDTARSHRAGICTPRQKIAEGGGDHQQEGNDSCADPQHIASLWSFSEK